MPNEQTGYCKPQLLQRLNFITEVNKRKYWQKNELAKYTVFV